MRGFSHFFFPIFVLFLESPIADSIQQTFLDDLLSSYGVIETSFTKHLYHLYKGFEFRSLWDVSSNLVHFERTASEAAPGTGMLQGALQLNMALQKVDSLTNKGRQCFTRFRHTTNTHKWSFNNVSDAAVSRSFVLMSKKSFLSLLAGLNTYNHENFQNRPDFTTVCTISDIKKNLQKIKLKQLECRRLLVTDQRHGRYVVTGRHV